jgi:hypothetical protein
LSKPKTAEIFSGAGAIRRFSSPPPRHDPSAPLDGQIGFASRIVAKLAC